MDGWNGYNREYTYGNMGMIKNSTLRLLVSSAGDSRRGDTYVFIR